jgi:hypothetical protein
MPTIRIPPGVVRGESEASIPGRWFTANFIRWVQGVMKPVGGWERTNQAPLGSVPRGVHVWLDLEGDRQEGILCDGKVFRKTDNVYYDITPVSFTDASGVVGRGYGSGSFGIGNFGSDAEDRGGAVTFEKKNPTNFDFDNWSDQFLFSTSADGRIWVWDPKFPANLPTVAVGTPSLVQGFTVTDEHHLMTFGGSFGGDNYRNRVAWSDQGNREGWDFTNVTGQAGFFDLEGAGTIISSVKIPGAVLIFTTTSVWICRYIGTPYYYSFIKIAEGCTPISPQAVAVAGSRVFWMGAKNFWKFEGGVVAPLPSTLGTLPFDYMDETYAKHRVTAGFNGAYPEIWFYYPGKQPGKAPSEVENTNYIVFNFDEGWWSTGEQARSMFVSSPIDQVPIAGHPLGFMYQHETGYLDEGQPRLNRVWAEVGTLSFDDGATNWSVNQAQIDSAQGPESVLFKFRGRTARGGAPLDLGTYTPRPDGYLDTHFTARDFTMRIEGRVDAPWSLGAMVFKDPIKRGQI